MPIVQMTTIATELESLLKNPNPTPYHPPYCSQSYFSKIIVSENLISLPHLKPFMTHCPNIPSKEPRLDPPPSLPTCIPYPPLQSCQTSFGSLNTILLTLSLSRAIHMLFCLYGMFSSSFYVANAKLSFRLQSRHDFPQKATLDSQDQVLYSQITLHSGL